MTKKETKKLAHFLYEIGTLRKLPRAHRQRLLTEDVTDNISSHEFRVSWIGWFLANLAGADPYKTMLMCMLHDVPEARSGDQNWVNKLYVKVFEEEIVKDQLSDLPKGKFLKEIYDEYEKRESLEAKLAKDADLIDQLLLLKEHAHTGNKEAERWLHLEYFEKQSTQYKLLSHKVSKQLARELVKQNVGDWSTQNWTSRRR